MTWHPDLTVVGIVETVSKSLAVRYRCTEAEDIQQELALYVLGVDSPVDRIKGKYGTDWPRVLHRALYQEGRTYCRSQRVQSEFGEPSEDQAVTAYAGLSSEDRYIFDQIKRQGRSQASVADELGVSQQAVGKRLNRVMEVLLTGHVHEPPASAQDEPGRWAPTSAAVTSEARFMDGETVEMRFSTRP